MSTRAAELKTLNQTSRWKHLTRCAYDLGKAYILGEHADYMSASRDPDDCLVLFSVQFPIGVNLEKLWVQGSLKQAEHQFFNSYVNLW